MEKMFENINLNWCSELGLDTKANKYQYMKHIYSHVHKIPVSRTNTFLFVCKRQFEQCCQRLKLGNVG